MYTQNSSPCHKESTWNYIQIEKGICWVLSYLQQFKYCTKVAISCRINMTLAEIVSQEIRGIRGLQSMLLSKSLKQIFELLLGNTIYRIQLYRGELKKETVAFLTRIRSEI